MNDVSLRPEAIVYQATHKVRFVTAASLFDGHDASINIMRRILQSSGCEVIHLGHDRRLTDHVPPSAATVVDGCLYYPDGAG